MIFIAGRDIKTNNDSILDYIAEVRDKQGLKKKKENKFEVKCK